MPTPRSSRRVASCLRSLASLGLLALGAVHCSADEASPTAATGSGSAPAPLRLIDEELSIDNSLAPESMLVGRCVIDSLPTDQNGVPDCVMLVSRKISDDPAGGAPACERCDQPGQRVPSAATLARARLPQTETGCLCEIVGQPPPPDGDLDKGDFGFSYLKARGEDDPSAIVRHCPSKASLAMRGGTLAAMNLNLTIACY